MEEERRRCDTSSELQPCHSPSRRKARHATPNPHFPTTIDRSCNVLTHTAGPIPFLFLIRHRHYTPIPLRHSPQVHPSPLTVTSNESPLQSTRSSNSTSTRFPHRCDRRHCPFPSAVLPHYSKRIRLQVPFSHSPRNSLRTQQRHLLRTYTSASRLPPGGVPCFPFVLSN